VITIDALFVINAVFHTGQIVATRGVYDLACQNPDFAQFVQKSLNRHVKCDWGDVDGEDNRPTTRRSNRVLGYCRPTTMVAFPGMG